MKLYDHQGNLYNFDKPQSNVLYPEPEKKQSLFSKLRKKSWTGVFLVGMLAYQIHHNNKQTEYIQEMNDKIQTSYISVPKSVVNKADHVLVIKDPKKQNIDDFLKDIPESNVNDIALVIDKTNQQMSKYRLTWHEEDKYDISTGLNPGDKNREGDMKTPEGIFPIEQIQTAINWAYDGVVGAYGPKFLRLSTPGWEGIGIHGTNEPEKLGERASHGCIRMENEKVEELSKDIKIGTSVLIEGLQK